MVKPTRRLSTEKDMVDLAIAYVFRELSASKIAERRGVSSQTIRRRLREFGVPIRSSAEQRHCDRRHGRYSHAEAIRNAWRRGSYDTDAVRRTRRRWYGYERHGAQNPFYGKKHSEETKAAIAERARNRVITGIGEYGDDWTEELRERIVARDDRRCQVCGSSKGKLQVHHVDLDRTNNVESNLLTLCAACHLAYHGRRELQDEIRAAHAALLQRLAPRAEVQPC